VAALSWRGRVATSASDRGAWFLQYWGRSSAVWVGARRVGGQVAPPVGVVRGKQRREERDAVGGNFVISSKFKISAVNSIFLPLNGLKRKTSEYHFCLVFRDLELLFQALFHLSNGL